MSQSTPIRPRDLPKRGRVGACLGLAALCVAVLSTTALSDPDDDIVPQTAIVELVEGADIEAINDTYGTTLLASIPSRNIHLLHLMMREGQPGLEQVLENDERVEAADVNDDCQAPEAVGGDTQPFFFYVPPGHFLDQFDDPLQLGFAHAQTTGEGIIVALVDTGVDAYHEILTGSVLPNGYNFIDSNTNVSDVGNGVDDDGDGEVDEMVGHGTEPVRIS